MSKKGMGKFGEKTKGDKFSSKVAIGARRDEEIAAAQHELHDAKAYEAEFNQELAIFLAARYPKGDTLDEAAKKLSKKEVQKFLENLPEMPNEAKLNLVSQGLKINIKNPLHLIFFTLLFSQLIGVASAGKVDESDAIQSVFGGGNEAIIIYNDLARRIKESQGVILKSRDKLVELDKKFNKILKSGIKKEDLEIAARVLIVQAAKDFKDASDLQTSTVTNIHSIFGRKITNPAEVQGQREKIENSVNLFEKSASKLEKSLQQFEKSLDEYNPEEVKKASLKEGGKSDRNHIKLMAEVEFRLYATTLDSEVVEIMEKKDQIVKGPFAGVCADLLSKHTPVMEHFLNHAKLIIFVNEADEKSAKGAAQDGLKDEVKIKYYKNEKGEFSFKADEVLKAAESFFEASKEKYFKDDKAEVLPAATAQSPLAVRVVRLGQVREASQ